MERLLFGTAGIPLSSRGNNSITGIRRIHELGLGCMELEFVRGVKMGRKTAHAVRETAEELDIRLSVHAPYYINLNSTGETLIKSKERILESARVGNLCGATDVVVHAASYQGELQESVYETVKQHLVDIRERLNSEGMDITLRIETMGRSAQFGSLDEVLDITEVGGVLPCIDFSHLHARTGRYNTKQEFASILTRVEEKLGREGLDAVHIHVSGIAYSENGEIRHLVFSESDFKYRELGQVFHDFHIQGMVISESPNLEVDALLLKQEYEAAGQKERTFAGNH